MALADTLHAKPSASPSIRPTIASHLTFTAFSALALLLMYSLLRGALLIYNRELMGDTPASTFVEAFYNGMRFDLRVVVYACIPLLLALFSVRAMAARSSLSSSSRLPAMASAGVAASVARAYAALA